MLLWLSPKKFGGLVSLVEKTGGFSNYTEGNQGQTKNLVAKTLTNSSSVAKFAKVFTT